MTALTKPLVAWHTGPMIAFDLETTGVDVEQDRVVTASIARITPVPDDRPYTSTQEWLANPGIPIPDGAAAIHGITTERAVAEGRPPADVLTEVVRELAVALHDGTPIVGMNLVYDCTLLDRECLRHGVTPLSDRVDVLAPIIDVRILDKAVDPYRRGGRKLTDLCAHYGVRIDNAHESTSDAYASLRVAWKLATRYPAMQVDLMELHRWQVQWSAEQTASFAAYRRKQGQPLYDEDGTWPIKPRRGGDVA